MPERRVRRNVDEPMDGSTSPAGDLPDILPGVVDKLSVETGCAESFRPVTDFFTGPRFLLDLRPTFGCIRRSTTGNVCPFFPTFTTSVVDQTGRTTPVFHL